MKKPLIIFILIIATLIILKLVISYLESAPTDTSATPANTEAVQNDDKIQDDGSEWQALSKEVEQSVKSDDTEETPGPSPEEIIAEYGFDPAKIESLRNARENGDPRTPPIKRQAARELPTPEELADPELYSQYEQRQENKFFAAYVRAVDGKVASIRAVVEQGKQHGMSEEDIAMAEAKIKGIQDMAARILKEKPDVAAQLQEEEENKNNFPLLQESE